MPSQSPDVSVTPYGIREYPVPSSNPIELGAEKGISIALKWSARYAALIGIGVTLFALALLRSSLPHRTFDALTK